MVQATCHVERLGNVCNVLVTKKNISPMVRSVEKQREKG